MMRWMLGIGTGGGCGAGLGRHAVQADYEDGQRAWDAGRHSEALREWRAAANSRRRQGDAGAGAPLHAGPGCAAELRASA